MKSKFPFRLVIPFAVLLMVAALNSSARVPATQAGPTLLKRTVIVSTKRFLRYWPNLSAAEPKYNTWSWAPQVSFQIGIAQKNSLGGFAMVVPAGSPPFLDTFRKATVPIIPPPGSSSK